MFLACAVVLGFVHGAFTAVITTSPATCNYKGKTYNAGERFKPSPCEPCFCSTSGQVACAIMDCAMAMCVDAEKHPDQCCATCPNGLNCKHGSTVIKMGDVYKPDSQTQCRCPENHFGFGFGSHVLQAVCTST